MKKKIKWEKPSLNKINSPLKTVHAELCGIGPAVGQGHDWIGCGQGVGVGGDCSRGEGPAGGNCSGGTGRGTW